MFILGNFFRALANIIDIFLNLYMWIIIIQALLSWVSPDPYNPIVKFLYQVTEPVLLPVRRLLARWISPYRIGIDFSPIIVILFIIFLRLFLVSSLLQIAMKLR